MAKLITLAGLAEFLSKIPAHIEAQGFVKSTTEALVNYYKKAETYTKTQVDDLIAGISSLAVVVADELPEASAETLRKIYLVPSADPKTRNVKDEFITVDNGEGAETRYTWEKIGDTTVDLSNYYTKAQADEKFVEKEDGKSLMTEAEHTKLADIAEGAQVNLVNDVTLDGETVVANKVAALESATNAEIDALFE